MQEQHTPQSSSSPKNRALFLYFKEVRHISAMTKEEEHQVAARILEGDDSARNRLIEGNLRLVIWMARRYVSQRVSFLDIINAGNIGLIEAARRYDPRKATRFASYANFWIRLTIQGELAQNSFIMKIPLDKGRFYNQVLEEERKLKNRLFREPSISEVAASLKENEEAISHLKTATRKVVRLDRPRRIGNHESKNKLLEIPQPTDFEKQIIDLITRNELAAFCALLSPREAEVIHHRFDLDKTGKKLSLAELSKRFGLSIEGIRLIEKRALEKLVAHCN
ncbi:RNA polymerase sigma factor RpoD/SigA [candidate division CSSED10-310 bacterium]|uniref:RNA polymerase sigma factor RpoD/SigA n=1 Tax=candidate division CSSED10-310 bacterium TaxID=2855610 RepID=A0ABV6Z422_UNCC1